MCQAGRNEGLDLAFSACLPLPLQHTVRPHSTPVVCGQLNCCKTLFLFFQTFQKDANCTRCSAVHPWCLDPHVAACSYIFILISWMFVLITCKHMSCSQAWTTQMHYWLVYWSVLCCTILYNYMCWLWTFYIRFYILFCRHRFCVSLVVTLWWMTLIKYLFLTNNCFSYSFSSLVSFFGLTSALLKCKWIKGEEGETSSCGLVKTLCGFRWWLWTLFSSLLNY